MSFRLFIYYCAACGAGSAFLGWVLGRLAAPENAVGDASLKGMWLGMALACGLGVVDALWSFSVNQVGQVGLRALVAVIVGGVGGFVGGAIGQILFGVTQLSVLLILGWTVTGLLIGGSVGVFDFVARYVKEEDTRGARRKVLNGLLGGAVGGFLGGVLSLAFRAFWTAVFRGKPAAELWSPSAMGFVVLGLCIGLLIGLAQVILKEAWLRVEAGFRPGREMILSKAQTTIGRAESCDLGLFGDAGIDRLHAWILQQGNRYLLADAGSQGGTFLNGEPVSKPTPLRSGDSIRVGNSVLRFGESPKPAG
jgi:hypothetical protein